jgi:hypothetical protein
MVQANVTTIVNHYCNMFIVQANGLKDVTLKKTCQEQALDLFSRDMFYKKFYGCNLRIFVIS